MRTTLDSLQGTFRLMVTFKSPDSLGLGTLRVPYYRRENWGSVGMRDSASVILLMSGGAGLEPKSFHFCFKVLLQSHTASQRNRCVHSFNYLSLHLCIQPFIRPSVHLSIYPPIHPSISIQNYSLRTYYIPDTVWNSQFGREDSK